MLKKVLRLALLLCCFAGSAAAANLPGAFTLSPMIGEHVFEGNQSLDSSSFWGIGLGYNFTENWGIEGFYTKADADAEDASTSDTKVETYHLDALYHFRADKKLVPYLVVGMGAINSSPDHGSDREHFLFNYGAGIKYFVLDDLIALRAEVRHLVDFPEPYNNLQYSAGLTFQLGKKQEPVTTTAAPQDSDGDGVYDDTDQCPNTPRGAAVDNVGCPLDSDGDGVFDYQDQCPDTPKGATVDAKGCPLDSDGDGVFDYIDQCPDTPKGAPVDSKGCPLDSDGDGVFDYLDKCPGTPAGVSVDENGCPTKLTLYIDFEFDSSKVSDKYDSEIAKAAQCINEYPGDVVFIDGHTDSTGTTAYNQKLSEQRAAAVKNRLVSNFDIPEKKITTRGFGESQPIADNKTAEGRAKNRRVDVACGVKELLEN